MLRSRPAAIVLAAALAALARPARAHQTYYASSCAACHGSAVDTCNGCHAHGTHPSATKDSIDVAGTLDATSYAPGATVTVTITGGYRAGWFRALLLDQGMAELARSSCPGGMGGCTTTGYPVTLTAAAPSTPGTYRWNVAWYGNVQVEASGASFGSGTSSMLQAGAFTPDPNNPNHGWQVVALPELTVTGGTPPPPPPPSGAPAIALEPASLDLGSVAIGSSGAGAALIRNTGTASLTVASVAACSAPATSAEFGWSTPVAAPFTIAPGESVQLAIGYAPVDAGVDAGCVAIASDDPQHPSVELTLAGTGTDPGTNPPPPSPGTPAPGGCATGSGASGSAVVLLLAVLAVRLAPRRRRATARLPRR